MKNIYILYIIALTLSSCSKDNSLQTNNVIKLISNYGTSHITLEEVDIQSYSNFTLSSLPYDSVYDSHFKTLENHDIKQLWDRKRKTYFLDDIEHDVPILKLPVTSLASQIKLENYLMTPSYALRNNEANQKTIINYFDSHVPQTYHEKFNYLRLLISLSENEYQNSNTMGSAIILFYGLHFINSQMDQGVYQKFSETFINLLSIYFLRETFTTEYIPMVNTLNTHLSEDFLNSWKGHMHINYLMEESEETIYKQEKHLLSSIKKARTPHQKFVSFFNYGVYLDYAGDEEFIKYYLNAIEVFKDNHCNQELLLVYLYILSSENKSVVKPYMNMAKNKLSIAENCPENIVDYIQAIIPSYIIPLDILAKSKQERIDFLENSRTKTSKLWSGRGSLHIQDFYMENLSRHFDNYVDEESIENSAFHSIVNLGFDTRRRDVYRQQVAEIMDLKYLKNKDKSSLNMLLLKVNNFKTILDFKALEYKEMFDLFINIANSNVDKYQEREIKVKSLLDRLQEDNTTLLNIFKGYTFYYYYISDGSTNRVYKLDNVDSLLEKSYVNFINKKENNQSGLFDFFSDKVKTKNVILISDGLFTNLPIHTYLSEKKRVYQFSNIEEYLSSKPIKVKSNDISILSYSSKTTIQDSKPKKITELPIGLEECNHVQKILNTGANNFYTGKDFTKESLFNSASPYVHISSHAFSSMTNRFDNYIVTRKNGQPSKVYGFEIYDEQNFPDVVVLSACETGIGVSALGAGVQTLSRSFLDNGTQTVIKTLWKVNEKATAEFMVEMYTHWVTGISLYDALEKTKENFKDHETYAHPYYWAGFVLEGNPNVYLEKVEKSIK